MSIDTNWDVDKYRTKFESEEHWALKRDFINAHKDKIPEERLICLSQVFVNIELLRCKYPDAVMTQVAVLAKEIGHDYKKSQLKRLQRTFVKASDAASAKVRGKKSYQDERKSVSANTSQQDHFPKSLSKASSSGLAINKYVSAIRKDIDDSKPLPQQDNCPEPKNTLNLGPKINKYVSTLRKNNNSPLQLPEQNNCPKTNNEDSSAGLAINKYVSAVRKNLDDKGSQMQRNFSPKMRALNVQQSAKPLTMEDTSTTKPHLSVNVLENPPTRESLWSNPKTVESAWIQPKYIQNIWTEPQAMVNNWVQPEPMESVRTKPQITEIVWDKDLNNTTQNAWNKPISNRGWPDQSQNAWNKPISNSGWPDRSPNEEDIYAKITLVYYSYSLNQTYSHFLMASITLSKMKLVIDYTRHPDKSVICKLHVANHLIGTGNGVTNKEALEDAAKQAIELLLKKCRTVKILKYRSSDNEIQMGGASTSGNAGNDEEGKISDDSVGAKLLKLMGWSGGALGKAGEGITEPIKANAVIGRQGLGVKTGNDVTPLFKTRVRQLLLNYADSEDTSDLVFAPDLSNVQRALIHKMAFQVGKDRLRSSSYGKKENRHLVISRKVAHKGNLQLILNQGGVTDKYKVFNPGTLTLDEVCKTE